MATQGSLKDQAGSLLSSVQRYTQKKTASLTDEVTKSKAMLAASGGGMIDAAMDQADATAASAKEASYGGS